MPAIKKKVHPYYNFRKLFSYDAMINSVVGGRGLGKTYGAKKKGISDALRKGTQFVYLRRTVEEIKAAKLTFFNDIQQHDEFPDYDFKVSGKTGQAAKKLIQEPDETDAAFQKRMNKRPWIIVCYFVALSVAQNEKGTSYPLVTMIIFDEFIIEKSSNNSYLRSEVEALMNFYSTVDRGQDKTRILMLANSVTIMNPYFTAWKIRPDRLPELSVHANGNIVAHFPDSADYQKSIYETRFGKFIAETMPDYADYSVGNQFKDAHEQLIAEKTKDAKYKYSVETSEGTFSVWYSMRLGTYFIQAKRPGNERLLTLLVETMDKGKIRVTLNEPVLKTLKYAFNRGSLMFDYPETRNAFAPIFDRK